MTRLVWHVARRDLGLGSGLAVPFRSTPDVLRAAPSPNRVMGHCVLPLAQVRSIATAGDAKVNDVVLAAVAGGAHALLESRGELAPDLDMHVSVAASIRCTGVCTNR